MNSEEKTKNFMLDFSKMMSKYNVKVVRGENGFFFECMEEEEDFCYYLIEEELTADNVRCSLSKSFIVLKEELLQEE